MLIIFLFSSVQSFNWSQKMFCGAEAFKRLIKYLKWERERFSNDFSVQIIPTISGWMGKLDEVIFEAW